MLRKTEQAKGDGEYWDRVDGIGESHMLNVFRPLEIEPFIFQSQKMKSTWRPSPQMPMILILGFFRISCWWSQIVQSIVNSPSEEDGEQRQSLLVLDLNPSYCTDWPKSGIQK